MKFPDLVMIASGAFAQGLLWAVMTIGVFITYRILDTPDLSIEGSITIGASIAARLIISGNPLFSHPWIATLIAMLGGMAAGLVTALLSTKLKIPALLSGILTMIALYSINIRVMGKANISLLKVVTVFTALISAGLTMNFAVIALGLVIVSSIVLLLYWFFGTEIGCAIRATGDNESMVRAQGVNTDNTKTYGLVLSNGLVALSGALIAQNQGFSDISMGVGSIVIGLASVIIGEVLFYRGNFFGRLVSIAAGAIVYRLIIALVLELGMQPTDLKLFTAITVALALWMPNLQQKLAAASPDGSIWTAIRQIFRFGGGNKGEDGR